MKKKNGMTPLGARKLASVPGMHRDAEVAGLYLQVKANKTGKILGSSWVLRIVVNDKRRTLGLGGFPTTTLGDARARARRYREMVRDGLDPGREAAARKRETARVGITFEQLARERHEHHCLTLSEKEKHDRLSRLERYVFKEIGNIPVADVTTSAVVTLLKKNNFWNERPTTANRVRMALEDVFSNAIFRGLRKDNPAAWKDHLEFEFKSVSELTKKTKRKQPALPYKDMPVFMRDLRSRSGQTALALELCILTATRAQAVTGANWNEFDLDNALWTIPARRAGVKNSEDVEIPLSPRAMEILRGLPAAKGGAVWNGLTVGGLNKLLERMHKQNLKAGGGGYVDPKEGGRRVVPHGFRASFRTWCSECTNYSEALFELALGHKLNGEVRVAYDRTTQLERRRELMTKWAEYFDREPGEGGAKVVPIRA